VQVNQNGRGVQAAPANVQPNGFAAIAQKATADKNANNARKRPARAPASVGGATPLRQGETGLVSR
jgi:hypothetical protein